MKINVSKEMRKKTMVGHLFLTALTSAVKDYTAEQVAEECKTDEGVELDLVFTINGHEADLNIVCEQWEKQVDRMIKDEAKQMLLGKTSEIDDLWFDLKERLEREIENRLEDWEK